MKKNGHATQERKNGSVYTPEMLSNYVAEKMLRYALQDKFFSNLKKISIADPASGDGILLKSIAERILQQKSLKDKKITIVGTDIDQNAITFCKAKLASILNERLQIKLVVWRLFGGIPCRNMQQMQRVFYR